jgi:hypothetical protein
VNDEDIGPFESAFRRLSGALNRKWTAAEFRTAVSVYFDALKHADLADVLAAETTLRSRNRWPKAGDWLAALPVRRPASNGERVMRTTEVDEYMRALRLHYHGEPCDCVLCQSAEVTHLPLRFVPDFCNDMEERAFCPPLNHIVTTGHWAHGDELRRWYAAKQEFSQRPAASRVLRLLSREPGEDG